MKTYIKYSQHYFPMVTIIDCLSDYILTLSHLNLIFLANLSLPLKSLRFLSWLLIKTRMDRHLCLFGDTWLSTLEEKQSFLLNPGCPHVILLKGQGLPHSRNFVMIDRAQVCSSFLLPVRKHRD